MSFNKQPVENVNTVDRRQILLGSAALGLGVDVAGPATAYIARRADRWRFNVILRGQNPRALLGEPPGIPWSVDVDPESLL